ncbi:hypothetical protein Q3O59_15240 [Alkalimonas delamerensis]|uniref:Uncharacterized protein n=1 Tax=Alkalimonas delamerensis TaxID=265981 RepID=A0ABT9GTT0_9GAMM|nr:hypothetical protein [Alkalimonas delamerensis]MDP4530384.1 hypothetical protein [Alkalimonas delamerensis]
MAKLTPSAIRLVKWLAKGYAVAQCTSPGRSIGRFDFPVGEPDFPIKTAFNTLYQYTRMNEHEFVMFGMRWCIFTLTKEQAAELLEANHDPE